MSEIAVNGITRARRSASTAVVPDLHAPEMEKLQCLSARIGRDPLLVQASSGNTSLKRNGTLWVKASGKWLADAGEREIFVPVSLSECRECLNDDQPPAPLRSVGSFPECLHPSIETYMHAVLPQRVVVHVHCVNTIAWAIRLDARQQLSERLSGLAWQWIPYVSSGMPLAQEVQRAYALRPRTDVFVLGNHGLVVCGETCDAAESLLFQVQRRLAIQPRPVPTQNHRKLEQVRHLLPLDFPQSEALHLLGTDAVSRQIIKRGVLYPCQVIFLGPQIAQIAPSDIPSGKFDENSPFIVIEGSGVLVNSKIKPTEQAVLDGLVEVLRRIDPSAPIRYLEPFEIASLLTASGDQYRMSAEIGARLKYG